MIDGKLTNHKDKDFVMIKTYKEVKAVSEQNARFILKIGTRFRTKAKLYCTAAASCAETNRSVLVAFTVYATLPRSNLPDLQQSPRLASSMYLEVSSVWPPCTDSDS